MSTVPPPGPGRGRAAAPPVAYRAALALGLASALLWTACGLRGGARTDPVEEALERCEAVLAAAEPSPEQLETHLQCLLAADLAIPEEPRVYARLARALTLRAQLYPVTGRDDLAVARSWALRCLLLNSAVVGRLQASGGRLGERPLQAASLEEADCLVWGALAWSRWLAQRGVLGAAIDLDQIESLAARAVALHPEADQGRAWHARAVSAAIVPAVLEPDPALAGEAFVEAMRRAPARRSITVDHAELILGPEGEQERWTRALEAVAAGPPVGEGYDAYEDLAARQRATRLLEAGPPAPSRW